MNAISIDTLMAKKKQLDAEMQTHGRVALEAEFKKFFDANP